MVALAARFGRGLPADVIPMALPSVGVFGHAEALAAFACGFHSIEILPAPRTDLTALEAQCTLACALMDGLDRPPSVRILAVDDPDQLCEALYAPIPPAPDVTPILPLGQRRDVTRLAARALATSETPPTIELPEGAPYGEVQVNTDACTLCLSCVGLCPTGALDDNPDAPELRFKEDACLQCGICRTICPENAITLAPRLDLSDDALALRTLHKEEPFACVECGTLFGVKSTIERIVAKLDGQHALFTNSDNTRLIQMCDDCRVRAQYHGDSAPMRGADRPRTRTTDDYLKERDE